ncbi:MULTISPECIES: site-2 protease family protein [Metabacillus]|uniref:Site-2 protease family protein n=1 Tax=Metabacillus hrfriensis TaxID=3048891 RepID=A0ACD4RB40_9BACI|nr:MULTISPECIES: site-2 protease family protein [Metabacillus]UAL52178.1 site-2 protease family protein [Metabacillus dongyingensis]UOK57961.1 site-2 protease family protein [Bacillus sp. OVS6]USK28497.1 site-2 protease family protein [Bacillus sp. CMF21]WHZ57711.1 site-2 protease family protein [Metabacillus sp. CT-WN-B3]
MVEFLAFDLELIPYVVIVLALAFTVHEFAHAYVAYKFGDPTAKNQGRLTLSPFAHLDPIGTLLIFIAGFGWAKPVPVNRFYFKNPRLAGVLVSVAGPLSNLVIAFIGLAVWYILLSTGALSSLSSGMAEGLHQFFNILIFLNITLFIFNLFPFPPLDGYRIIEDLAPSGIRAKMTQFESYGMVVFLILVLTPLDKYTIQPAFSYGTDIVMTVFESILNPFF